MGGKNKNRNKKKLRRSGKPSDNNDQVPTNQVENEEETETEPRAQNEESNSIKRQHGDDDSDHDDDKPRRKKKKKPPVPTDSTDKKGKKSIRQMKREKFAERQAQAQAASKDQLKGQCLNYLSQWKHDKQNWKFMKIKQVWLFKNKFSSSLIPDSSWPLLLEYFESAQGNIRKMLLDDANKIIKQMDEWTESEADQPTETPEENDEENNDDSETPKNVKPNENVYKRARDIIQCLEE